MVDGSPMARLLFPMDINNGATVEDYSGNIYDGSVNGATWVSYGVIGGGYSFDGNDAIENIGYCFTESTLSEVTVEVWIKTDESYGTIASYNREKYWDLGISDGKIRWSTTTAIQTADVQGQITINDNQWHHVIATYNSATGESSIYVDGFLDVSIVNHAMGQNLGTGDLPNGLIGKGESSSSEVIFSTDFETENEKNNWVEHNSSGEVEDVWETLTYDSFESGWGSYQSGGGDCTIYTMGTYAYDQDNAVNMQQYGSDSSFSYDNRIDIDSPGYTSLTIDFWYRAEGIENGEYFRVFYFDGSFWHVIGTYVMGTDFTTGQFYHEVIWLNETEYSFPSNMDIGFRCYADHTNDDIYIDKIFVNASGSSRLEYTFDLLSSAEINPLSGSYSLGGYGDFDPESVAFNRTSIDVSDYYNVSISLSYKYKNVEPDDFFGMYYLYNDSWTPIFEESSPSGEISWTSAGGSIPDDIDDLILQFKWVTSAENEYFAIEDLEVRGSMIGNVNYSGLMDEFTIYQRALSDEQIYQNYLCSINGESSLSAIVSEETIVGQLWNCIVTPVNAAGNADGVMSNGITIFNYGGG